MSVLKFMNTWIYVLSVQLSVSELLLYPNVTYHFQHRVTNLTESCIVAVCFIFLSEMDCGGYVITIQRSTFDILDISHQNCDLTAVWRESTNVTWPRMYKGM